MTDGLKFLTVEEVSGILGFTPYTIRKWTRAETLKSIKIGNRILIRKQWLDAFIKNEGKKC